MTNNDDAGKNYIRSGSDDARRTILRPALSHTVSIGRQETVYVAVTIASSDLARRLRLCMRRSDQNTRRPESCATKCHAREPISLAHVTFTVARKTSAGMDVCESTGRTAAFIRFVGNTSRSGQGRKVWRATTNAVCARAAIPISFARLRTKCKQRKTWLEVFGCLMLQKRIVHAGTNIRQKTRTVTPTVVNAKRAKKKLENSGDRSKGQ